MSDFIFAWIGKVKPINSATLSTLTTYTITVGSGGSGGISSGAAGGSGIVIVRYSGSPAATGGTITTSSPFTIHTFTGPGTFRANAASYFIN